MTERDQLRVEFGLQPIDVDPPRTLTAGEWECCARQGLFAKVDLTKYEPVIGKGYLFYRTWDERA